jgi:AcrR family transcriptional regulator
VERLVQAAAEIFGARGFAETSIDDINRATQLTRGALYHHFENKTDLFRAVFERKETELVDRVQRAAARSRDPWVGFEAGCMAFLEACQEPQIQRIVLIDGPAVLGWDEVRSIEARTTLALIRQGIERALQSGRLARRPVDPLAQILLGGISECAKGMARSGDPGTSLKQAKAELSRILAALVKQESAKA